VPPGGSLESSVTTWTGSSTPRTGRASGDDLTAEHAAAQAEADRLLDSEAEVERDRVLLDAEQETRAAR
jgi:hypothetical protein